MGTESANTDFAIEESQEPAIDTLKYAKKVITLRDYETKPSNAANIDNNNNNNNNNNHTTTTNNNNNNNNNNNDNNDNNNNYLTNISNIRPFRKITKHQIVAPFMFAPVEVSPALYRGSYPTTVNFSFLKR